MPFKTLVIVLYISNELLIDAFVYQTLFRPTACSSSSLL